MSQAGKGHVPEENLTRYRSRASIARKFEGLGNDLSNIGHYEVANDLYSLSARYWKLANALRVDLPTK